MADTSREDLLFFAPYETFDLSPLTRANFISKTAGKSNADKNVPALLFYFQPAFRWLEEAGLAVLRRVSFLCLALVIIRHSASALEPSGETGSSNGTLLKGVYLNP